MTLHVINPKLFYENKLPPLSLENLLAETHTQGERHLFASAPFQCELSFGQFVAHRLVGSLLYVPVINTLAYLILRAAALYQTPLPPVFYKNQAGVTYWHNQDASQMTPRCQEAFKLMAPLDPSEYLKEYVAFKWRMQIQEAINLECKSAFQKLLEEGKGLGLLDTSFCSCADYHCSLIHSVAKTESNQKFIRLAFAAGIDFGKKDSWGNTGLIWSIANASNGVAMKILKIAGLGANINAKGWGNTALHLAVGKGYKNVSAQNTQLKYSNLELVQALIAHKANVNIQNDQGNTPLHLACMRRDLEMIRALLLAGADPKIENKLGETPRDCIMNDYNSSQATLKATVGFFLLDQKEFEANAQKAFETFFELTIGRGVDLEEVS